MVSTDITATTEWAELTHHARELQAGGVDLAGLFEADLDRAGRCHVDGRRSDH